MRFPHFRLVVIGLSLPTIALAQGPLAPTAAPTPEGRTLLQIEPRADVNRLTGDASAVYVIAQPGSYHLTADVVGVSGKAGIRITAANVTLDLNGFRVIGIAGATYGVDLRISAVGVVIRRGSFTDWPTSAIGAPGTVPTNGRFEDLTITGGGNGINLNGMEGAVVTRVSVTGGSGSGIFLGATTGVASHCTVSDASASTGTLTGIGAGTISDCTVKDLANSGGAVIGINGATVTGCEALTISSGTASASGIAGTVTTHCHVSSVSSTGGAGSTATGISGTTVTGCNASTIGASGTSATIGIDATNVEACSLISIGSASGGSGTVFGISAASVSHCSLGTIGATTLGQTVTGISGTLVSDCRVNIVRSAANLVGITGTRVTDSTVIGVFGNTDASIVAGISSYRLASGCAVQTVSNAGTGGSAGFLPASSGETLHCNVNGTGAAGLRVQFGGLVRDCSVSGLASGTGIVCDSTPNTIDQNDVTGCANGISTTGAAFIVRNHVTNITGTKINPGANSQVGPSVNVTGTIAAATSPWANFTD